MITSDKKIIRILATSDIAFDQRMLKSCVSLSSYFDVHIYSKGQIDEKQFKSIKVFSPFKSGFLFYAYFNLILFLKLLFKKTDIIVSVDLDTIPAGFLLSRLKSSVLVYDAHEYYVESPELDDRPKVKRFWSYIADYCLPKIENNYTVCLSLVDILSKKYGTRYELIQNVPYLKKTEQINEKIFDGPILYQGVLNVGRGLEEMIQAMRYIDKEFWICGDGDIREDLEGLVNDLDLNHKVIFKGKLLPQELEVLTHKASLGLNLLDGNNKNYFYSLANKHFDYMHAGVPILGMNFPEYQRINKDIEVASLIDDLNIETIKLAILELMRDSDLYNKLHSNCLKAKEKYSWQKEEFKLLEFYQSLV